MSREGGWKALDSATGLQLVLKRSQREGGTKETGAAA